jgi:hypothetical protein
MSELARATVTTNDEARAFGRWSTGYRNEMLILGVILLVLGFIFGIPILWTIGIILAIIGLILLLLGAFGRGVGPRRYYW